MDIRTSEEISRIVSIIGGLIRMLRCLFAIRDADSNNNNFILNLKLTERSVITSEPYNFVSFCLLNYDKKIEPQLTQTQLGYKLARM